MPAKPTKSSPPKHKLEPLPFVAVAPMQFQLGDVLRCRITGITGVAVCYAEFLYGCRRWSLQSAPASGGNERPRWEDFDEHQLELVARTAKPAKTEARTGGPRPMPSPARAPAEPGR